MGILSEKVMRLQRELGEFASGRRATAEDVGVMRNRVADLLCAALEDERHPLAEQLMCLQERIALECRGELYREFPEPPVATARRSKPRRTSDPNRHFFMPHPGAGDSEARRYWKLQLLLYTASQAGKRVARLANILSLSVPEVQLAAKAAARSSVDFWSDQQYVQYLEQAAAALDLDEPALPFRLNGRIVQPIDGSEFKLSRQEADLLQRLIDNVGRAVTHAEIKRSGINYPKKVKGEVVRKFRMHDLDLPIFSSPGAYRLTEA